MFALHNPENQTQQRRLLPASACPCLPTYGPAVHNLQVNLPELSTLNTVYVLFVFWSMPSFTMFLIHSNEKVIGKAASHLAFAKLCDHKKVMQTRPRATGPRADDVDTYRE
jgi:hypothetical protein